MSINQFREIVITAQVELFKKLFETIGHFCEYLVKPFLSNNSLVYDFIIKFRNKFCSFSFRKINQLFEKFLLYYYRIITISSKLNF